MMRPVSYSRVTDVASAVGAVTADPDSAYLAGGTSQIDLMRGYVAQAGRLVDINDLPLAEVSERDDGGVLIGALARMSDVAAEPAIRRRFPMLAQALLLGASPQLRNMATIGGNLLQRTRCPYFRDIAAPCNKRVAGSGCSAIPGINRGHAVLGTSDHCIATHPSDAAVALVALDAVVHTQTAYGRRTIRIDDFFLLPGETPQQEHPIEHGELIVAIELPFTPEAVGSVYYKVRDRESYDFALAAAAAAVEIADGVVARARLALGGVATKPWRARRAEQVLTGAPATMQTFAAAAEEELRPAIGYGYNDFKIELARRTLVRALRIAADDQGAGA